MRFAIIGAACLLLTGCGLFRATGSWVELSAESDSGPVSEAIVVFVAQSVPENGAAIILAAPPSEQSGNRVSIEVREKLLARGYQLADGTSSGHRLRYLVSKYGDRTLLRVSMNDTEASVLFARDAAGALRADAPLTMRQKGKVL